MAVISPTGLLGTRSPILITWNGTGSSPSDIYYFKLEVYAWTGDKDVRPSDPIYTINRTSGFVDVYPTADIAPLLENEFVNRTSNLAVETISNMSADSLMWVEVDYDIEYLSGGFVVNDTGTTTRFLVSYGYSNFLEQSNKDLGATFLVQGDSRYLSVLDTYVLPVFLGDVGSDFQTNHRKVKFTGSDGTTETYIISDYVNRTSDVAKDRVVLIPAGVPNLNEFLELEGGALTQPDLLDWYDIEILDNTNVSQDSIRIYNQCEAKYDPIQLQFVNKWGMWDTLTFFKRSDTDLRSSKETYRSVVGSASSSGYTWDKDSRGMRSYNHEVNKSMTLNTGFVDESLSDLIEQLMMSEYVIMTINRTTYKILQAYVIEQDFRAVNLVTDSLRLQKHINDKTINYTIEVEFATPENAML